MATPTADSYTATSGTTLIQGGRGAVPATAFQVAADGIWTWFTMPEAVQSSGYIYTGVVTSAGRCFALRTNVDTQATESFDLSGVLEVDDHNNASVLILSGGRVAFFYGTHNDTVFRYRIWDGSGSFASSGSWTTAAARGTGEGPYSYPKPVIFPSDSVSGRVWLFSRRWTTGGGTTRAVSLRNTLTFTGSSDPWSAYTDVVLQSGARPYVVTYQDGDKLHFAMSSAHPNEATFITIHHFYGDMSSGSMVWRDSAGSVLTPPFAPTAANRADDGGDKKRWVSDVGVGSDGHPRILFTRYPNNDGTAIEYWHSRWTGSAWVATKITDDGAGLYAGEPYYSGGIRFHQGDTSRIYLSAPVSGVRQVQEWRTTDSGATWAVNRVLTSGGTAGNPLRARPIGVRGGDGRINVMWWEGEYTTYTDYSTTVQASG